MSVHWSVAEWRALGVDVLHTYLSETPAEQIHPEAAAAYLELIGGKAAFIAIVATLQAVRGSRQAGGGPAPEVRMQRHVCDDELDTEHHGREIGTRFLAGAGAGEVEIYFPDGGRQSDVPEVYIANEPGLPLATVERVLPLITAILADPRVIALRAA